MPPDINSGLLITRKPDSETHGNHLRAPLIGIRDLRLKAGGKSSVFHLPENAPDPSTAETGKDDFNFLPEYDTCDLVFDIDNPFDIVDRARIEITKRFEKTVLWTLDLVKLGPTWIRHGVHTVKWPGQIIAGTGQIDGTINGEATEHNLINEPPKTDASVNAPFPDGWLTLEHPPYKLRLVLESDKLPGNPAEAWTYFHVMLEKIEIKLGPEAAIPSGGTAPTVDMEKAVRNQFTTTDNGFAGALPAPGATAKIYLISNNFKQSEPEFNPLIIKDYDTYKDLWGDGPRIPLLAKLWLRAADGSAVDIETSSKGAKALGRAKFMWDWKDPDENTADAPDAEAVTYLANSRNYYKNATDATRPASDHTYPEGDNSHIDRGGARGPNAQPIFPPQPGYASKTPLDAGKFPFAVGATVVDPKKRKWAAFSTGWTDGALKGHTGVLFRPTRMAGDNFIVSVQLAWDWDKDGKFVTDVTDKDLKVPAKITAKTGTFEVWRRIQLSRYIRKNNAVPRFASHAAVAAYYSKAFIEVRNDVTPNDDYTMDQHHSTPGGALTDYNALARDKLTAAGYDLYDSGVLATDTEDHASVPAVFKVAPYATFVRRVHSIHLRHPAADFDNEALLHGPITGDALASALGTMARLPDAPVGPTKVLIDARRKRLNKTRNYLRTQEYRSLRSYSETVEGKLINAAGQLATTFPAIAGSGPPPAPPPAPPSAPEAAPPGIVVLHWEYVHSGTEECINAGKADPDGLRGAAIDAVARTRDTVVFALWRPLIPTFAHEIGHHMFLPHTKPPHSDSNARAVHDKLDPKCLMSYHRNRHNFCGLCLLRLRGWDSSKLKSDSTKNKKPP